MHIGYGYNQGGLNHKRLLFLHIQFDFKSNREKLIITCEQSFLKNCKGTEKFSTGASLFWFNPVQDSPLLFATVSQKGLTSDVLVE